MLCCQLFFGAFLLFFFEEGGCGITKSYAISFLRNVKKIKKQRTKQLMICLYFWCDDFIPHTLTYFFPLTFFSHFTFCFAPGLLSHFYVLFCDFVNKNAWMPIVAGGDKFTTLDKCSPWTVSVVCGLMHLFFCWKSYKEFKCQ